MATLSDEIREFVRQSLIIMEVDLADVHDDGVLGPAGADLDSLMLAELVVRVEDQYDLKFTSDEMEMMPALTVREFCDLVAAHEHAAGPERVGRPATGPGAGPR
jgi:acyl carrier protein